MRRDLFPADEVEARVALVAVCLLAFSAGLWAGWCVGRAR